MSSCQTNADFSTLAIIVCKTTKHMYRFNLGCFWVVARLGKDLGNSDNNLVSRPGAVRVLGLQFTFQSHGIVYLVTLKGFSSLGSVNDGHHGRASAA